MVDTKNYQTAKQKLLEEKLNLEEKLLTIRQKGSAWVEPMKDFIKGLIYQQKIAKAKNTGHELAVMAKKLGSNFFLSDRCLKFSLNSAWCALAVTPDAARAQLKNPELCREEDLNLHAIAGTCTSSMPVYQFQHPGFFTILSETVKLWL